MRGMGIFKGITTKFFFLLLLMILPIYLYTGFVNLYAVNTMQKKVVQSLESLQENYVTLLENRLDVASYMLWAMKYENRNERAMLAQTDEEDYAVYKTRFHQDFEKSKKFSNGLDKYFYIAKEREDILLWGTGADLEKNLVWADYQAGLLEKGRSLKHIGERECLFLYADTGEISYGGWIYLDAVQRALANDVQYENTEYSFTEEPGENRPGTIRITSRGIKGDLYMNMYLDKDEIFGEVHHANIHIWAGSALLLLLFPLLYVSLRRLLIKPLQVMNAAFKEAENGHMDFRITDGASSREYQYSYIAFNAMMEKIRSLKIEAYEKQLEKEKMELETLQLQIRPHFLLNTFNLLYALEKKQEGKAIQDIILYLSGYFRYLFRGEKSLEMFQKEQQLIEGYIKMAKICYPDSIDIEYEYDPEIMFVRVPPLLLHGFVENIVKHVVKQGAVTHISILGQYGDKQVTFMIMDDGQGIPEEKLKELDAGMRQEQVNRAHIGFSNALKRMRFFYGSGADITLTSVAGEGTCVTIIFPYDLEEEE